MIWQSAIVEIEEDTSTRYPQTDMQTAREKGDRRRERNLKPNKKKNYSKLKAQAGVKARGGKGRIAREGRGRKEKRKKSTILRGVEDRSKNNNQQQKQSKTTPA